MGYKNTKDCLDALDARGELLRIDTEIDANIEIGAIQRRVFQAGGPALLFTNVKGCQFPMAANIYGTKERVRFIFRDTIEMVERLMKLKLSPMEALKKPWKYLGAPRTAYHTMPRKVSTGPVMENETTVSKLPQLISWPMDGGGYVTLPQVYSESPEAPGFNGSNIGMYRVQLSGNDFTCDEEVGLHYQIHRGIGHHHAQALKKGEQLKVNIFVGGAPAMTMAAVMPLPEGLAEIFFAGAIGGHRIPMVTRQNGLPIPAEADFCISGSITNIEKPEGPFGDHLGYYSLAHNFPVLKVDHVYHRNDAIWPFTTVGRPPQEDTMFGEFIHELTADLVPSVFSGVHEVHAVDAAGVHPLLLAVGSERYVPYAEERQPQELLTNAMGLLGNTQTSLSKYVFIAAKEDMRDGESCHNIPSFFHHMLQRADLTRDLHFITRTTIDTLDYSGISLNQGSKLVFAAAGSKKRELSSTLPTETTLPDGFCDMQVFAPGILILKGPKHQEKRDHPDSRLDRLGEMLKSAKGIEGFPMIVVADDADFTAQNWDNFLWVTFTRSDPATDMYGVGGFTHAKHWGAEKAIIIDARLKTYHAPALEPDPEVEKRVDALGAAGGPLYGII
ncbi:UbiD family decarboxylase [Maridesulfovibrio hydrothermalis]|uniref:Carboxylyase-related protein n=1 Tax=Maridesulfovibrio hydrothermalis AM13 = DSM 14728 TaxID=1121451 RepID=L0RBR1_9BACT|nr:UbiD family decarboxylase [Maridesulfovibrio hydrothermalis]CCO24228.1 Carboxylyase-related protein [Maridesulfovibrio hydrothermalis AM13 = DSM 14728]